VLEAELTAATGHANAGFRAEVEASREVLDVILAKRPPAPARELSGFARTYVDSEQALLAGHPHHPTPKWRSSPAAAWEQWAPELRTAFPLHWLAVPAELVADRALDGGFDRSAAVAQLLGADGARLSEAERALPVHPWQLQILRTDPHLGPLLRAALDRGVLRDLGRIGPDFHPTASVRTLYQPDADVFLKTSLDVRITNCLRRHELSELTGAVEMTRLLRAPAAEVRARHPGFALLDEPAARTVSLGGGPASRRLAGALGSICRSGLRPWVRPGEQVHLVGSVVAEHRDPVGTPTRLTDLVPAAADPPAWALEWWERYLRLLVAPVLRFWVRHGVVLEPHLQNVLVVVGADGLPTRVLVRDMEGTKLLHGRWREALGALPRDVAATMAYTEGAGRSRVAYCLLVNNLLEVAASVADLVAAAGGDGARSERAVWAVLRQVVAEAHRELDGAREVGALLTATHLPAKANLLLRWRGNPDRAATYVALPNPLVQDRSERTGDG
jgi:siderophore synthetase component